ncbi:malate:quinone oxidoreductase, partial [Staphylococcus epidermidis]|uniref:malate:quinone oxidoreductase n=1 Tax=Staphylococcus epidermidis TaxID=1282 RepID=UPI0021B18EC3
MCEFNYTKEPQDGSLHITNPIHINHQFQLSKHFSPYLIPQPHIQTPHKFIQSLPHITFLKPQQNLKFLKTPLPTLHKNLLFQKIKISQ